MAKFLWSKTVNLSILVGVCLVITLLLVALVLTVRGGSCDALNDCDAFKPICANYEGEHQFFYSQCDMVRENCMTGKNWKLDHYSHCNVYV